MSTPIESWHDVSSKDDDTKASVKDDENAPTVDEVIHPLPSDHEHGTEGPANAPFAPADVTPPSGDNESSDD